MNINTINIAETSTLRLARNGDSIALRTLLRPYQGDLWQVVAAAIPQAPQAHSVYIAFTNKLDIEIQRYTLKEPVGAQLLRSLWHHLLHCESGPTRPRAVAAMVASRVPVDRLSKLLLWDSFDISTAQDVPKRAKAPGIPSTKNKIRWFRKPLLSGIAVAFVAVITIVMSQIVSPPASSLQTHTQLDTLITAHIADVSVERLVTRQDHTDWVETTWQSLGPLGTPTQKRNIHGQVVRGYTRSDVSLVVFTEQQTATVLSSNGPLDALFLRAENRLTKRDLSSDVTTQ